MEPGEIVIWIKVWKKGKFLEFWSLDGVEYLRQLQSKTKVKIGRGFNASRYFAFIKVPVILYMPSSTVYHTQGGLAAASPICS